jgi:hypothetical protein
LGVAGYPEEGAPYAQRKGSNTKVYLRYLLLNGRQFYTHLFHSQTTWVLLVIQVRHEGIDGVKYYVK